MSRAAMNISRYHKEPGLEFSDRVMDYQLTAGQLHPKDNVPGNWRTRTMPSVVHIQKSRKTTSDHLRNDFSKIDQDLAMFYQGKIFLGR